jgi:hypothetical protein
VTNVGDAITREQLHDNLQKTARRWSELAAGADTVIADGLPTRTDFVSAERFAEQVFNNFYERVDEDGILYPDGVLFCFWCKITRHLALSGWTVEELAGDAAYHAMTDEDGSMQATHGLLLH